MSERFDFTGDELAPAYRAAVDAIEAGDLVVLPTDTMYGIAADAFKADAVQRLLDAKGRGRDMPPPVLISVVESLDALATDIPEAGRKLCQEFWPGPLTVICHAQTSLMWDLGETQGTVALRVPDHENTRELLSRTGPLAVSSANLSGRPAALDVYDAEEQLKDAVAVYLDGGPATGGQPSTIVDLTGDTPHVVRLGALSLAELRAVVPEVTSDLENDQPAEDEQPAENQKPVEEKSAGDEPAAEKATEDKKPVEADQDGKPVAEKAADGEEPAGQKAAGDEPAAEKATDATPVADEKAADVTPVAGEKTVGGEPTGGAVGASKSEETDKATEPDVRPAD
ncbi:L-threonylcarbamoyladenylate synthase [Kribbella swartbergensis]